MVSFDDKECKWMQREIRIEQFVRRLHLNVNERLELKNA
jgi:hypothetical protein